MNPTQTLEPINEAVEARPRKTVAAGTLLAVCGLCGGAGTSTLAYLIAHAAARSGAGPAMVCDTGGPTAGLFAYAGVQSPRSLAGAADALAAGEALTEGLFVTGMDGLRVIARGPDLHSEGAPEALSRLLCDAREAHRLTVVDCGTLGRAADRLAMQQASHVAWVLPATLGGVDRARKALSLFEDGGQRRELVVARHDASGRKAPLSRLTSLAESRRAPLVLAPHVADLAEEGPEPGLEQASVALDAIASVLGR